MTKDELLVLLREACAAAESQQAWAKAHGMSASYVGDVLRGRREPGPKVCAVLGFKPVVSYEPQKKRGRRNGNP
jgi:hypothetical protein